MKPTHTRPRRAASLGALVTVVALAALTGCSGSPSDGDSAVSADVAGAPEDAPAPDGPGDAREAGGDAAALDDGAGAESAVGDSLEQVDPAKDVARVEPGTSVIRTGTVSLEADDVAEARFDVRKVVDAHRGTVTEQETTTGDEGDMSTARLVLRVPSASFEDATRDLEDVATLLSSSTTGEDVSTQVVDVDARIRAQRASVSRVEALLARASDLQQVISIERQLAERQADLDSLVAQQTYLADQTALSTITVTIEQPDEDGSEEDDEEAGGFAGGLEDGWDSFVAGLVVALTVVGFVLPWLILVAVLGLPLWLVLRRRAGRRPGSPPAPAAP
ncbi:MAG TPA: DUF4349 domain-containing protein [Nocardioides sp.]|nr:DUF4349 domain-containing protein [Nocardioides sp.]